MVSTKADVIEILHDNKMILSSFGVYQLGLFGSFLHDQANNASDIDLIVEFEPDQKTFTNFSNLIFFLEEIFGRRVEVVTLESISPHIGPQILREVENV
ncbi:MAG: nucleotidyltransferase family protein, partial [Anaerolineaceae bacterium]|nr:nucleotidyltransferase family protein [Anaerolineaceae bacterium]